MYAGAGLMCKQFSDRQYHVAFLTVDGVHDDALYKSTFFTFLARDSIYAIARYMPSPVRPSVCLSVRPTVCHTGGSVKDGYS